MAGGTLAVLLVEDNPGDANLVEHHLHRGSFPGLARERSLTHVKTLSAARERVAEAEFDLILLDLGLPESSGIETLERFLPEVPEVPVIVLTGLDDKESAVEAIQRGAQDYLPKGDLDADALMRSIRYAIERHKQERALRRQAEQMRFFNSVLRHDVGNGMEVIRRNAQVLEDDLEGANRERAETILAWTDDIVDLTRKVRRVLATDADEDDLEPVDVASVIRDRAQQVAAIDDDATVELSLPDRAEVLADDMLPEVVGNVLSNAIEHNDTDSPRVSVELEAGEEWTTVAIADNGPGVPEEDKERIFGRGTSHRSSEGGFGLYFVSMMLDSYGGEIGIEDNEPRGSVFRLRFRSVPEERRVF